MRLRDTRFPIVTTLLGALALVVWWIPGASETLQFDRTSLVQGELWRLLTGHLTHWTSSHLAWDLAAFVLLGTLVERRSRAALLTTLLSSALVISGAVWLLAPVLSTYRGLSGIDSALFISMTAAMTVDAVRRRRWVDATIPALAAIAFVAKIVVESVSTTTLFVAPDASFIPVPLAHIAGAAVGLVVAAAFAYSSSAKAAQVVAAWPWGSPTGRLRSR